MSILRAVDPDGTKYYFEDDGKLTVKQSQNTDTILKKINSYIIKVILATMLEKT